MRYSRGMNGVMLMSAMILASAYNRQCNPPRVRDTRGDCPNFRKAKITDSRQLREFSVKGLIRAHGAVGLGSYCPKTIAS